jgi:hypothetical protein
MAVRKQVKKQRRETVSPVGSRALPSKDAKTRKLVSDVVEHGILEVVADDPALRRSYLRKLDLTPTSLSALDRLIKRLWGGEPPSEPNFNTMVWAFGAYVAEVIQRNHEGRWRKFDNEYSFECTDDGKPTGFAVYPWAWVKKRFEENDLLALKYRNVMKIADNFSGAKKVY